MLLRGHPIRPWGWFVLFERRWCNALIISLMLDRSLMLGGAFPASPQTQPPRPPSQAPPRPQPQTPARAPSQQPSRPQPQTPLGPQPQQPPRPPAQPPPRPSPAIRPRPPQWGLRPPRPPSFFWRPNDRAWLRRHYRRNLGYINRARRPRFVAGGFFPWGYVPYITPLPPRVVSFLPPPPPGYMMGYFNGYVVVYDPASFYILSVIDLL